jgi:hypothetical protein
VIALTEEYCAPAVEATRSKQTATASARTPGHALDLLVLVV